MPSSIFDSNSVLPLWAVSSRANSSRRASSGAAVLASRRPRCRAESLRQPSDSKQARAPLTAASTSAASPRATSAITAPVAGFTTGKRRPEAAGRHSLLMKRSVLTGSLAPELRHALLLVRGDALLGILALEQLLLQLALDRQATLERHLGARLHRTLDQPHGFRGLVRRTELFRVQQHLLPVVLRGQHLVDQAELLRPVEREQLALDHQLDRQRLADDAGEPLRAPRAGQHAEVDLGEADLAGVLLRQPQIAGHGDLEPTADGMPVERSDGELGRVLQAVQRLVGVQA